MNLTLNPLLPIWATVLLTLPLLVLAGWALLTDGGHRLRWARRLLMVVMIVLIALRPVTPDTVEQRERLNANVFFVVDQTGSMNAEDMPGGDTRLSAVQEDMTTLIAELAGARFSVIGFDSAATTQLPLTTDVSAVHTWVETLRVEPTAYSQGSNVDRARDELRVSIEETVADDPDSHVIVYLFSDGENTDGQESQPFTGIDAHVDAGAVLGYGTAEGGRMRASGAGVEDEYIQDPAGGEARSVIDEQNLQRIAQQLGLPYLHRVEQPDLAATFSGLDLQIITDDRTQTTPTFADWYWIPAIVLAGLFIWELGALTYRIPRRTSARDVLTWEDPRA